MFSIGLLLCDVFSQPAAIFCDKNFVASDKIVAASPLNLLQRQLYDQQHTSQYLQHNTAATAYHTTQHSTAQHNISSSTQHSTTAAQQQHTTHERSTKQQNTANNTQQQHTTQPSTTQYNSTAHLPETCSTKYLQQGQIRAGRENLYLKPLGSGLREIAMSKIYQLNTHFSFCD